MTQNQDTQDNKPALRFAVPKNGHLKKESLRLLEVAGITFKKENNRLDFATAIDTRGDIAPFEILFQRASDAVDNIDIGIADLAITGLDVFEEKQACNKSAKPVGALVAEFNFSACGLWIAAPAGKNINAPEDLIGLRIVTSYPNALKKWLSDNNVRGVNVITRQGGVEDYVRLGVADAVCDIVESGSSLKANGLEKIFNVMDSSAVLVQKTNGCGSNAENAALLAARLAEADTAIKQGRDLQQALKIA